MGRTLLWLLFVANAVAFVGLLAVAVRGVRRASREPADAEALELRDAVDLTEPAPPAPDPALAQWAAVLQLPPGTYPSPRAALDEVRWSAS